MKFQLLDLPVIILKRILLRIDFCHLLELSMVSKKLKSRLQLIKLKTKWAKFHYDHLHYGLSIRNSHQNFWITIVNDETPSTNFSKLKYRLDGSLASARRINRQPMNGVEFYFNGTGCLDQILEKLVRHFLSFLQIEVFDVTITRNFDFQTYPIWKFQKIFGKIEILSDRRETIFMGPEDIRCLFGDIEAKSLSLEVLSLDTLYQIPPGIACKHLEVSLAPRQSLPEYPWLDYGTLLNLDVPKIRCKLYKDSEKTANCIFKQWTKGRHQRLEKVELVDEGSFKYTTDVLFNGINFEIDYQDGVTEYDKADIVREIDGRLATVHLKDYEIHMIVSSEHRLRNN